MLSVFLKHEIHTVSFKRSSGKEMNTFHVASRTIQGLRRGEISNK